MVACLRERLSSRAALLGWRLVETPTADLHLSIEGRRVDPTVRGRVARFTVPAGARSVWLVADAAVPAEIDGADDRRALGVCIGRLVVDDGFAPRIVEADDPRLCAGFHGLEDGPQRWTGPRARLPSALWSHCGDAFFLRVEMTRPALARWRLSGRERSGSTVGAG